MQTFGLYLDFLLRYSPEVCKKNCFGYALRDSEKHQKKRGTEKVGVVSKKFVLLQI